MVSLAVAGGAFVYSKQLGKQQPIAMQPKVNPENIDSLKVLVVKRDLKLGETISADSIGWQDWPKASLSQAFITQASQKNAIQDYTNGVVKTPMLAGEPIIAQKVVLNPSKSGIMSAILTPGMRATTIPINANSGVAGFVMPNDHVDVILTRTIAFPVSANQTQNRTVSSTIFENVRVLAIDANSSQQKSQQVIVGTNATLELSPDDSEELEKATKLGDISLTLRSYADYEGPTIARPNAMAMAQPRPIVASVTTQGAQVQASNPSPASPASVTAAKPAEAQVKVYRGGQ